MRFKLNILHTSDWHLGRSLYRKKRYPEFESFLGWLSETIEKEKIDLLLVAGDIFDNTTPSNKAQELYYKFLINASSSCCKNIIITSGNHDSPAFLDAPKELLRSLNVYVTGSITDNPEDEVIIINNSEGTEPVIVCAVPYLRDRDIRTAEPGETIDDKNRKLIHGIKEHYSSVISNALSKKEELEAKIKNSNSDYRVPIIAIGHLFASGGTTVEGDGVRELYVGSLIHVGENMFPSQIDYLALGHLHVPQKVAAKDNFRYCGSPIPMGFGESNQKKTVIKLHWDGNSMKVDDIQVPCFQRLCRIRGSIETILQKIESLKSESRCWIEIEYTGDEIAGDLRSILDEAVSDSNLEILRIKNQKLMDRVIHIAGQNESLEDLNPDDVFSRCLDSFEVPLQERDELITSYHEIIQSIQEEN
jgi:exonuclease SbcD